MKKNYTMKDMREYRSPELSVIEIELEGAVLAASADQFFDDEEDKYLNGWS